MGKGSLTCKDTLLVGWGGATDSPDNNMSCPVAGVHHKGSSLELEGCTLQLHPESTHVLNTTLVAAASHAQVKGVSCKFVGPAPESSTARDYGVIAQQNATVGLVSGDEPEQLCRELERSVNKAGPGFLS
jgi:hypothetical protein